MKDVTRREALGVGAMAGAMAFAGLTPGVASAQDQPNAEFDEEAERQRVMACGLNEEEEACWVAVADAAGSFFDLPTLHPMDGHEVSHAIHVIQHKLLSRPVYRCYKDIAGGEQP